MNVVFDLDGTLVDNKVRWEKYQKTKIWDFHNTVKYDTLISRWTIQLRRHLRSNHKVEIWSARENHYWRETKDILEVISENYPCDVTAGYKYISKFFRPNILTARLYEGVGTTKKDLVKYVFNEGMQVDLVYDDSKEQIAMFESFDIPTIRIERSSYAN